MISESQKAELFKRVDEGWVKIVARLKSHDFVEIRLKSGQPMDDNEALDYIFESVRENLNRNKSYQEQRLNEGELSTMTMRRIDI